MVHLDKRIKNPTLLKSAVSQKLIQETISEELRVLYVAMTRAREKLYMIGTVKDAQKAVEAGRRFQMNCLPEAGIRTRMKPV